MDNGTIALLISPLAIILTALITSWLLRRSSKEANDIDRFEAILAGQDTRIRTLESEVGDLKDKLKTNEIILKRIRKVVGDWFEQLKRDWGKPDIPMPLPDDEDLELLGITSPRLPKK